MKKTKSIKPAVILLSVLFAVVLLIPTFLVLPFTKEAPETTFASAEPDNLEAAVEEYQPPVLEVAVYRSNFKKIDNVPLDDYIIGVVASEMPAQYELEALKAQALSARTYIIKHLLNGDQLSAPDGADVTDTVMHQVYKSPAELEKLWGADYQWKMERIQEAVQATSDQIITYDGAPITAAFFSTSNGYTENSEDYWQNPFPYLKSVESPWDHKSPKFHAQKTFTIAQFEQALGVKVSGNEVGKILTRTTGNRVNQVEVGGKAFSGRDIRELLNLNSSDFTWKRNGNQIVINTKGWGHGVGMSQFGANGMAQEGQSYQEIVSHYYKGTKITEIDGMLQKLTAKQ